MSHCICDVMSNILQTGSDWQLTYYQAHSQQNQRSGFETKTDHPGWDMCVDRKEIKVAKAAATSSSASSSMQVA